MKPWRPEVASGVSSGGRAASRRPASRAALTSLPVAKPGWTSIPVDRDDRLGAGERLVLQLAHGRAVHRVGAHGAEALDVEAQRAAADLLVGGEADPQRRARQLGVRGEVGDRGHDLRDAGLVVGAQQRVAAGGHDVVALLAGQLGHLRRVEHGVVARQLDRAAGVGAVDDRLDPRARCIGARVDVGEEPDDRRGAVGRGQRGHHVAVVVELGVREAGGLELLDEHAREVELAGGARRPFAIAPGLGVDADVALEALQEIGRDLLGQRGGEERHRPEASWAGARAAPAPSPRPPSLPGRRGAGARPPPRGARRGARAARPRGRRAPAAPPRRRPGRGR